MIISHQQKFIYIHIYKVAGMSIRSALTPYDEMSKNIFPWYENIKFDLGQRFKFLSGWALDHIKAKKVKKFLAPELYNSYYKFTFVRNPWDWQVSLYHFMLQVPNHPQHKLVTRMKSFEEYIDWRVNEDLELQRDFIFDDQGNKIVDFVGRFEHLQEDFNVICKNINIPLVQLPYINKSKHKPYKEYYNESTKNLIGKAFKEDIELFKYEF